VDLPFDFQIKLIKPKLFEIEKKIHYLNYEKGQPILEQQHIVKTTDPTTVRRVFDGQFKYIKTPEKLVEAIHKHVAAIDLTYIELIVQNMFRKADDNEILGRYINYKDCEIISHKRLPFLNSWINNISFENPDKGLKHGLLSEKGIKYDPIEKIIIEQYGSD
jgi:hypothetical protein